MVYGLRFVDKLALVDLLLVICPPVPLHLVSRSVNRIFQSYHVTARISLEEPAYSFCMAA